MSGVAELNGILLNSFRHAKASKSEGYDMIHTGAVIQMIVALFAMVAVLAATA